MRRRALVIFAIDGQGENRAILTNGVLLVDLRGGREFSVNQCFDYEGSAKAKVLRNSILIGWSSSKGLIKQCLTAGEHEPVGHQCRFPVLRRVQGAPR